MTDVSTLAPAGTADLRLGASVAAIAAAYGPRIAFAPETGAGDGALLADLPDDVFDGGDDEPEHDAGKAEPAANVAEPTEHGGDEPTEEDLAAAEAAEKAEADEKEPDDSTSPDDSVKVKLDDGEEVTLAELKAGHLRQADYTRKTQETSRIRGELDQATNRLKAFDGQTRKALDLAAKVIQHFSPKLPDIAIAQSDPAAYLFQKEAFDNGQRLLAGLAEQIDGQKTGAATISDAEHNAMVQRGMSELIASRPELRDAKKRAAVFQDINTYGQAEYRLTADDLAGLTDPRAIEVLMDAVAYRKLKANRTATMTKVAATAPMRTATRQPPGQRARAGQAAASDRLRREGSIEAAAAAFDDLDF